MGREEGERASLDEKAFFRESHSHEREEGEAVGGGDKAAVSRDALGSCRVEWWRGWLMRARGRDYVNATRDRWLDRVEQDLGSCLVSVRTAKD